MWIELLKRWLDMFTWWLPQDRRDEASSDAPERASARDDTPGRAATPPEEPPSPPPVQRDDAPAPATVSDDLTAIKGIGPATRDRLHELGIHRFTDLAHADATALTERLKAEQMVVSRTRVQQWIDAAAERTE